MLLLKSFQQPSLLFLYIHRSHGFKNSSEVREPRFSLNGNHAYEKSQQWREAIKNSSGYKY